MTDNCLDRTELQQVIDQTGTRAEQIRFARHLDDCETCRDRLEQLAGTLPGLTSPEMGFLPNHSKALSDAVDQLTDAPLSRRMLGIYEIQTEIGRGGMGVVYQAVDTRLDRNVAIKVPKLADDEGSAARFAREARSIAAVKHEHIVAIYSIEENASRPFLVMEWIDGESLEQRLARDGRLPWRDVVRLGGEVAGALDAAHQLGIVHRDIKPANVLLEAPHDRARVTDFGVAKSTADPTLTAEGLLAGTPQFMSPEQADGKATVGPSSDVFSLGVMLYQACSGESPFQGETALSSLRRVADHHPRPLHKIDPDIPPWLSKLVEQAMSKSPPHRLSAAELHRKLSVGDSEDAPSGGSRRWLVAAALAIGLAALLAIGGWTRSRDDEIGPDKDLAKQTESSGFMIDDRHFRSLTGAIAEAEDGDVIEVLGVGPYLVPGFRLENKRLSLRGVGDSRAVLEPDADEDEPLFRLEEASLDLSRIEVRWRRARVKPSESDEAFNQAVIKANSSQITLSECVIEATGRSCVRAERSSVTVQDTLFSAKNAHCLTWRPAGSATLESENCVWRGDRAAVGILCEAVDGSETATITLRRNSFSSSWAMLATLESKQQPIAISAERNVFDVDAVMAMTAGSNYPGTPKVREFAKLRSHLNWYGTRNAYRKDAIYGARVRGVTGSALDLSSFPATLRTWEQQTHASDSSIECELLPVETEFGLLRFPEGMNDVGADPSRFSARTSVSK